MTMFWTRQGLADPCTHGGVGEHPYAWGFASGLHVSGLNFTNHYRGGRHKPMSEYASILAAAVSVCGNSPGALDSQHHSNSRKSKDGSRYFFLPLTWTPEAEIRMCSCLPVAILTEGHMIRSGLKSRVDVLSTSLNLPRVSSINGCISWLG